MNSHWPLIGHHACLAARWLGYVRAWDAVVEAWESGEYVAVRPAPLCPSGLLLKVRGSVGTQSYALSRCL